MPRIAIVADSSACLPAALIREYGIIVVPLAVHFNGEVYHDGEIGQGEFIERLRTSEHYPTTAAPAPGEFLDAFRRAREAGADGGPLPDAVVSLQRDVRFSCSSEGARGAEFPGFPVRMWAIPLESQRHQSTLL